MRTLGVDLAAQATRTGMCLVDWSSHPPEVDFPAARASDEEILSQLAEADKAGIDVPFGWPRTFVEMLARHRGHEPLPSPAETTEDRAPLCFRRTDQVVRNHEQVPRPPLSVSSNLVAIPAMRMAGLEDACRQRDIPVDRSGEQGTLCEVYPAATLAVWDQPSSGYKQGGQATAVRRQIAQGLGAQLDLDQAALQRAVEDDDLLDAFVCALAARAVADGHSTGPDDEDREAAAVEGWVHLPTCSVRELVAT